MQWSLCAHLLSTGVYSTKTAFMGLAINTEQWSKIEVNVCVCFYVCIHAGTHAHVSYLHEYMEGTSKSLIWKGV